MKTSLTNYSLSCYLSAQLNTFFPDKNQVTQSLIEKYISYAMQRVEHCFSKINNKYFFDGKNVIFNHLHSDQYAMFLYYLSNTIYKQKGDLGLCSKIFLLNKTLHGVDAFYEVALPDIFLMIHPIATILGRGDYSDYFLIYQRCGIGSNHDIYPKLGKFLSMHPGSSVLGNCLVGDNCTLAAESLLLDNNLANTSLYIGNPKDYYIKGANPTVSNFWHQ